MIEIKPGKYQHFKGNVYEVIGTGKHSETLEELVIYRNEKGEFWVRPKAMFLEYVETEGYKGPRFVRIEEEKE